MNMLKKGEKANVSNAGSTFYEKYILPNWSNVMLAVISLICLRDYYVDVTGKDIQHFAHVSYMLMAANALSGLLKYTNDDTYSDLRILLDYAQQVICLPLIVTDFLIHYRVAPPEIAIIPTVLALVTLIMFVILEYKRQDLTDLNMIVSLGIYVITGLEYNIYAVLASMIATCAYFGFKRREGVCLKKANQYNLLMSGFAFFSLLSFDSLSLITPGNFITLIGREQKEGVGVIAGVPPDKTSHRRTKWEIYNGEARSTARATLMTRWQEKWRSGTYSRPITNLKVCFVV